MRLARRRLRRTTVIALCLLCTLIGLGFSRRASANWATAAVVGPLAALTFRRRNFLSLLTLLGCCLTVGVWRGSVYMQKLSIYQQLKKTPVIIQATSTSDAVYAEKSQLSFDVSHVQLRDPVDRALVGTMAVKGFGEPMVYKGDRVQVEGKMYPTRGSRQASISYADIKVLRHSTSKIDTVRRKFAAGITSALPEPLGSFGLGLLIGQRTTLPKTLTDQLSAVGLTHIVAVSGYNLTIIVLVAHRLLHKRSKYQAIVLTLSLIGVFLLFTGSSASIVRAALVSALSLLAWYYGRRFKPHVLILLVAVLTAAWYPPYLWSDLGWWLSFLAFAGVLLVSPLLTRRFFVKREPKLLLQILLETTAAQVMTLPLIMYIFGKLSLIALLANMLIVPLVPLAMLLSLMAGLAGMLIAPVAGWFAWPANLLMNYMLDIIQLLSRLPHALVARSLRLDQMLMSYGVISLILLIWWQKTRKNRKITDRTELISGVI